MKIQIPICAARKIDLRFIKLFASLRKVCAFINAFPDSSSRRYRASFIIILSSHHFITTNFASGPERRLTVCDASALRVKAIYDGRRSIIFSLYNSIPSRGIGFSRYLIFCNRTSARCGPRTYACYFHLLSNCHTPRAAKPDSRMIYYSRLSRGHIDSRAHN